MQRTRMILFALIIGALAGLALRNFAGPQLQGFASDLLPLGQLWIRALQMTLVPLIFAMVAHGVVDAVASGRGGRLIASTLGLFAALLSLTALIAITVCEAVLRFFPFSPNALAGLALAPVGPHVPTIAEQIIAIIPENPVAAAAQGQIFPLVVFGIVFGLAVARLVSTGESGMLMSTLLKDLAHTMMTIVDWVLVASPVGIFILALGMAMNTGFGLAQVLLAFVGLSIVNGILAMAMCYLLVLALRAIPLPRFAAGIAPAQAMAAGTCSSMATTPAMIEVALERLGLPDEVAGLVIPLAVSVFRLGTLSLVISGALVAAAAAGIVPTHAQLLMAAVACILGSISGAGVPGAAVIYVTLTPALQLLGAPLAIVPLFIAVNAIADPIATMANVTADLTAATLVRHLLGALFRQPQMAVIGGLEETDESATTLQRS